MTAHKHAALMLQYAQDALETDKPWLRWEHTFNARWYDCDQHPSWDRGIEYRRKPRTITYTVTIPEPLNSRPKIGTIYYVPSLAVQELYVAYVWQNKQLDNMRLKRGACFTGAHKAIAAAKAMLPPFQLKYPTFQQFEEEV